MSKDILLQILKIWDFVKNFEIGRVKFHVEYFDGYQDLFFRFNTYYLRGYI